MYETVSLYTTLKIITFLRNNYFLCKHNLALRQREKVMQVKQWNSYSTPDHLTVPWQSSLQTQTFNKKSAIHVRLLKPDESIQQNSHSRELASRQSDTEPCTCRSSRPCRNRGKLPLTGKIHSQTFLNNTLHDCGMRTVTGIWQGLLDTHMDSTPQWLGWGRGTWDIGLGSNSYSNSMIFSS